MKEQDLQNVLNVDFSEVKQFVDNLAVICYKHGFRGIYAPPRGGLVIGVMLSHKTGLPMLMHPTKDCIIVDDIVDYGETLERYAGKCFIASLYWHRHASFEPDYWEREKTNEWLIFPWE